MMNSHTLHFIEHFLFDALFIDFNYFKAPFDDISTMDRYLRKGLVHSESLYTTLMELFQSAKENYYYIISDKYLLQYIAFRPSKDSQDIISIGPYSSQAINEDFFNKITKLNHLDYSSAESLKGFMYRLPVYTNNLHLISVINDIVAFINPEAGSYEINYINLSDEEKVDDDYTPIVDFELYVDSVKNRYQLENDILECISAGNHEGAMIAAKKFLSSPFEPRINNALHESKALLYSANTLFRKAAEKSQVHPLYLHQTSSKFAKQIEATTTLPYIDVVYEKMIRDYCLMVKNKARIQYSPLIRNALNYIEFNLSSTLSLSILANELHVSSPYLSSLFKSEIGITITDYINEQRIQTSLKLLNSTNMMIQDVASFVGIHDMNYFTKIFKKQIGTTPREYRKNVQT